jgi:hypothetical protein
LPRPETKGTKGAPFQLRRYADMLDSSAKLTDEVDW